MENVLQALKDLATHCHTYLVHLQIHHTGGKIGDIMRDLDLWQQQLDIDIIGLGYAVNDFLQKIAN